MPDSPKPPSLRAYARHRGVSPMSVSSACETDRLKACVVREPPDPVTGKRGRVIGISDFALADREWQANTDLTKAPTYVKEREAARPRADPGPISPSEPLDLSEASARAKHWQAELAELKYRLAAGELVEAKDVSRRLVTVFSQCKTGLLAIPSRARQSLPHLTVADVAGIEALVREALEGLAESAAGDPAELGE